MKKFAVIDIETTGGSPTAEKIIEIAIFIFDGENIIDEFVTLINPGKKIPYFIRKMTGIEDKMVEKAPKFYEIAKKIVQITEDCVFVAHNAKFDYAFIRNEFKSLGYDYKKEVLCTINLSKKIFPGKKSYSLGILCKDLNIEINNRHRAAGDALATVSLLKLLQKTGGPNFDKIAKSREKIDHPYLDNSKINALPNETGVYYFFNEKKEPIYIGKSLNIKDRVLSHLRSTSLKSTEMCQHIHTVDYVLTGSELVALLLESAEIKAKKPIFNRMQRRSLFNYGIYKSYNEQGYISLEIRNTQTNKTPVLALPSLSDAKFILNQLVENYQLCQKLCGLYYTQGSCFYAAINKCLGACTGKEPISDYNARAMQAIESMDYSSANFVVIDNGRTVEENAFIIVENNKYVGYGFVNRSQIFSEINQWKDYLIEATDNKDVKNIIRHYLNRKKYKQLLLF